MSHVPQPCIACPPPPPSPSSPRFTSKSSVRRVSEATCVPGMFFLCPKRPAANSASGDRCLSQASTTFRFILSYLPFVACGFSLVRRVARTTVQLLGLNSNKLADDGRVYARLPPHIKTGTLPPAQLAPASCVVFFVAIALPVLTCHPIAWFQSRNGPRASETDALCCHYHSLFR